jgi:hypothetical protein
MAELPEPKAAITLEGRTVTRGPISGDYGHRVHWKVLRDGKEVATPEARSSASYTVADATPGQYEISLETWKHEGYKGKSLGKYIEISNKVSFKI